MSAPLHAPVAPEVAFDYLADPANRPEWQSSLSRVEDVDGEVRVGQTWVDVTVPGLRPLMETTVLDRPHRWAERGTWRGFAAELTLTFAPSGSDSGPGCAIGVEMRLHGTGPARPLAAALGVLAPLAVRSDLKRAVRILSRRS